MLFFEIVGAYYGAFFIWQLVTGIMNMLSGMFLGGMKFHSFRFLNFKIGESQGRLTLSKDRVCFLPQFKIFHTPESMADNELIFYYSYLEKDLNKAERYKNQAPSMIENDMDLNGRRVYAYYLYGKEADTDKILEVIAEGLAVAQEYPMPGNIPMETKLQQYLRDLL